jgi:hypothetical protein
MQFEEIFFDYQAFTTKVKCILQSKDGQKGFVLVNQLLFEMFEHKIAELRQSASGEEFDFSVLRTQVLDARAVGGFFADNLSLLHEQTKDVIC